MYTILFIDDDKDVLDINCKYFQKLGWTIISSNSAKEGYLSIKKYNPNCIILDVMMPEVNGFSACKTFRNITNVPIIFLTGRVSEDDKIQGLLLGADDYITKPYSLRELGARIEANIKRHQTMTSLQFNTADDFILHFPPLAIDINAHKVFCNEEEISLSNREFELLLFLAKHVNEPVTFEAIGEKIWGSYSDNDRRSIMVNTSRLRKKLERYSGLETIIETVWSKGYQFTYHTSN